MDLALWRLGQRPPQRPALLDMVATVSSGACGVRTATVYSSANSSSFVTVVQFLAVAVAPSPGPASLFHSFDRATPSGCHAYSSRPIATNCSDSTATSSSAAIVSASSLADRKLT